MNPLLKNIFKKKEKPPTYPFITQGPVHIFEKNGGSIIIHPSVLLNSLQEGYHVGMPFETTIIADSPGARIQIGENCRIHATYIHAWKSIFIGKGVLIGAGTNIIDSNGHSSNVRYARFRKNFRDTPGDINIGDFVWIGMNCIILKGVSVGECTIISAGSVVKNSIPAFSLAEGNPAKVIQTYDSKEALAESYPQEKLCNEDGYYNYEVLRKINT
jgi:acetyltransferase-like isoleucine patch superfamily enzyme